MVSGEASQSTVQLRQLQLFCAPGFAKRDVIVRDCVGSPFQVSYEAALRSLERIFDVVNSPDIVSA